MGDITNVAQQRDVIPSSLQCPILNSTNYMVWSMRMKVMLQIHKVWETIEPGSNDPHKNVVAIGLLFQSISETLILQVGEQTSPKAIWDTIKAHNLGADRVKKARLQTLHGEFERVKMQDSDSIDSFAEKLSKFASKSASLGEVINEAKLVNKFLNCLPRSKYIQIVASLEQALDLETTSFEDIIGRLKAYEERIQEENYEETQDKLLYTNADSRSFVGGRGRGS